MVFTSRHNQGQNSSVSGHSRRLLSLLMMMVLVAGVTTYISLTNSLSTKGYEIKELEQELQNVKVTARQLETQAAGLQLYRTLADGEIPEGFVAVERIEYLAATPGAGVAVK